MWGQDKQEVQRTVEDGPQEGAESTPPEMTAREISVPLSEKGSSSRGSSPTVGP